jgi:hypothetical protein
MSDEEIRSRVHDATATQDPAAWLLAAASLGRAAQRAEADHPRRPVPSGADPDRVHEFPAQLEHAVPRAWYGSVPAERLRVSDERPDRLMAACSGALLSQARHYVAI